MCINMDCGNFKLGCLVIYLSVGLCFFFFFFLSSIGYSKYGFPGSSAVKDSTCKEETSVLFLGWEDPLEKG